MYLLTGEIRHYIISKPTDPIIIILDFTNPSTSNTRRRAMIEEELKLLRKDHPQDSIVFMSEYLMAVIAFDSSISWHLSPEHAESIGLDNKPYCLYTEGP